MTRGAWLWLVPAVVLAGVALALVRTCDSDVAAPPPDVPPPRRGTPAAPARRADRPRAPVAVTPGVQPRPETRPEAPAPGAPESAAPAQQPLRIRGRVVDETGVGVGGAKLELRMTGASDVSFSDIAVEPDGTFDIDVERRWVGTVFCISTVADGYAEGFVSRKVAEHDEASLLEIVVVSARAVAGRVVDADGRPLAGAAVWAWYGSETTWWRKVGDDGRFELPPRIPRRGAELYVEVPGYPIRRMRLPEAANDRTDMGDLVFRRGGRVAGVVVDPEGHPVPDIRVELANIGGGGGPGVRTDGAGRFEFTDVGQGVVGVGVCVTDDKGGAPGARRSYRGGVGDVDVGRTDVRLVAQPEYVVIVRFVDPSTGKPVDLEKIEYAMLDAGTPEPESLGRGASGSGTFSVHFFTYARGRYDVVVRSPGYETGRLPGLEVGGSPEVTIDLPMRRAAK